MKNPSHPGDLIRTEIIEALGLNVSKAADVRRFAAPRSPTFSTAKPSGDWPFSHSKFDARRRRKAQSSSKCGQRFRSKS